MKFHFLFFLSLLMTSGFTLPIRTIGEDFPEDLRNIFAGYGKEAHQYFDGKDVHGRDHIIVYSDGQEYRYAIYKDDGGMIWNILIDEKLMREIPFVNVTRHDGTIKSYHPEEVEQLGLKEIIPSKSFIYLSDTAPCLHGFTRQ